MLAGVPSWQSLPRLKHEGYSIPVRCKLLRSYARRHDYQAVREFIDVETVKQSGRTHFTEMIHFLAEHLQGRILSVRRPIGCTQISRTM